jgi:MFS family permease
LAGRLLVPGVAAVGFGLFACALGVHLHGAGSALILVLGSALCGFGLGVVQNVTLMVMFDRVGSTGYGLASTVWNVGFDAGTGLGAVVIGAVLSSSGAAGAFTLAGLFALAVLPVALAITGSTVPSVRRESRRERDASVR